MKFKPWQLILIVLICIGLGVGITLLFLFGNDCLPRAGYSFNFSDFINSVGVLFSFIAIITIILNTNKQIKSQELNLQKQLSAQKVNLQSQIKNQNKENYRPYITVKDIRKIADDFNINDDDVYKYSFFDGHILFAHNTLNLSNDLSFTDLKNLIININFKNIGYGIARSICFNGTETSMLYKAKDGESEGDAFSVIDLGQNEDIEIKFTISTRFETDDSGNLVPFADDYAHFLVFYSDLFGNIYSSMIIITVTSNGILSYSVYPHGNKNFDTMLKKIKGNYNKLLKQYTKNNLSKM